MLAHVVVSVQTVASLPMHCHVWEVPGTLHSPALLKSRVAQGSAYSPLVSTSLPGASTQAFCRQCALWQSESETMGVTRVGKARLKQDFQTFFFLSLSPPTGVRAANREIPPSPEQCS